MKQLTPSQWEHYFTTWRYAFKVRLRGITEQWKAQLRGDSDAKS